MTSIFEHLHLYIGCVLCSTLWGIATFCHPFTQCSMLIKHVHMSLPSPVYEQR